MTQKNHPESALKSFTQDYSDLFHDHRLFTAFQATITGIIASQSTRITQIAKSAPQTGTVPHSEKRIRRLIHNKNQRANLTPEIISSKLTSKGAKQLAKHDEVKVILDGSDLREHTSNQNRTHRQTGQEMVARKRTLDEHGKNRAEITQEQHESLAPR